MPTSPQPILAFLGNLAGPDMLVLVALALLIFGRRLPEVAKALGQTIREFKDGGKGPPNLPPPSGSMAMAQGFKSLPRKSRRRSPPPITFFRRSPSQKGDATADSLNRYQEPITQSKHSAASKTAPAPASARTSGTSTAPHTAAAYAANTPSHTSDTAPPTAPAASPPPPCHTAPACIPISNTSPSTSAHAPPAAPPAHAQSRAAPCRAQSPPHCPAQNALTVQSAAADTGKAPAPASDDSTRTSNPPPHAPASIPTPNAPRPTSPWRSILKTSCFLLLDSRFFLYRQRRPKSLNDSGQNCQGPFHIRGSRPPTQTKPYRPMRHPLRQPHRPQHMARLQTPARTRRPRTRTHILLAEQKQNRLRLQPRKPNIRRVRQPMRRIPIHMRIRNPRQRLPLKLIPQFRHPRPLASIRQRPARQLRRHTHPHNPRHILRPPTPIPLLRPAPHPRLPPRPTPHIQPPHSLRPMKVVRTHTKQIHRQIPQRKPNLPHRLHPIHMQRNRTLPTQPPPPPPHKTKPPSHYSPTSRSQAPTPPHATQATCSADENPTPPSHPPQSPPPQTPSSPASPPASAPHYAPPCS